MLWLNFILGSNFLFFYFLGIVMHDNEFECVCECMYVVIQFHPWFKFSFLLF